MDYAALKAEIALPAYQSMSDAAIAAALNAKTIDTVRKVATWEARSLLLGTGEWGAIKLLSRQAPAMGSPEAQAVAVAITTVDTMELTSILDADDPVAFGAMQAMVGVMQAAGVMTAETAGKLLALRDVKVSRADQLGLGPVRPGDVSTARAY